MSLTNEIEDIEASLVRYLYENLQIPYGIKVAEDLTTMDFSEYTEWVVVESLTNVDRNGCQPIQNWFIHAAVQGNAPNFKQKLNVLVDKLLLFIDWGSVIPLYSYSTGDLLGDMVVSDHGINPVMQHRTGGAYRPISISVVY